MVIWRPKPPFYIPQWIIPRSLRSLLALILSKSRVLPMWRQSSLHLKFNSDWVLFHRSTIQLSQTTANIVLWNGDQRTMHWLHQAPSSWSSPVMPLSSHSNVVEDYHGITVQTKTQLSAITEQTIINIDHAQGSRPSVCKVVQPLWSASSSSSS